MSDETIQTFSDVLRRLCATTHSVSQVCRDLGVNRQQFNKYLNGTNIPSSGNMHKIANYFGVPIGVLTGELEFPRSNDLVFASQPERQVVNAMFAAMHGSQEAMERHLGYYFTYHFDLASGQFIIRALQHLRQIDGVYVTKTISPWHNPIGGDYQFVKYRGIATMLSNRIFIFEHEYLTNGTMTCTILNGSLDSAVSVLSGISSGASKSARRRPTSTRIYYEFLGPAIDLRARLRECGAFSRSHEFENSKITEALKKDAAMKQMPASREF